MQCLICDAKAGAGIGIDAADRTKGLADAHHRRCSIHTMTENVANRKREASTLEAEHIVPVAPSAFFGPRGAVASLKLRTVNARKEQPAKLERLRTGNAYQVGFTIPDCRHVTTKHLPALNDD